MFVISWHIFFTGTADVAMGDNVLCAFSIGVRGAGTSFCDRAAVADAVGICKINCEKRVYALEKHHAVVARLAASATPITHTVTQALATVHISTLSHACTRTQGAQWARKLRRYNDNTYTHVHTLNEWSTRLVPTNTHVQAVKRSQRSNGRGDMITDPTHTSTHIHN